jgi:hypothetical protein
MSNCPFCNIESSPNPPPPNAVDGQRSTDLLRRTWRGVQWLFPTALLVLMPKCPLCVTMYIAMFTGIGVSVSTARWIQILMLVLCLASLGYLAFRLWRNRNYSVKRRVR